LRAIFLQKNPKSDNILQCRFFQRPTQKKIHQFHFSENAIFEKNICSTDILLTKMLLFHPLKPFIPPKSLPPIGLPMLSLKPLPTNTSQKTLAPANLFRVKIFW